MTLPPESQSQAPATPAADLCARCGKRLSEGDRVEAGEKAFCASCYETLRMEIQQAVAAITQDVNYPMAVVGALLGGAAGVLLWWGFTVVTKIAFGLVAVAIGFLTAQGAIRFAGGKRSRS